MSALQELDVIIGLISSGMRRPTDQQILIRSLASVKTALQAAEKQASGATALQSNVTELKADNAQLQIRVSELEDANAQLRKELGRSRAKVTRLEKKLESSD